jgi:hypothetical protein
MQAMYTGYPLRRQGLAERNACETLTDLVCLSLQIFHLSGRPIIITRFRTVVQIMEVEVENTS